ncbi:type II secretion system protein [Paraburkholderia heleia]|uniref:type II secretion system protein n=1 Tax=Paraburkholderia heleia TaxID=634127 RepID=UPI002AB7D917|nr:prepilin-type N-terminal cleavage/methylation domain-containing protein [Paraburkholderia heleia]
MPKKRVHAAGLTRAHQAGFSLVELSVVLLIIAIIVSVTIDAKGIIRSAQASNMFSNYIEGWVNSYNSFYHALNVQPGDNPSNPVGHVVGSDGSEIACDTTGDPYLSNLMLGHGISLPHGRAARDATDYVYEDEHGIPHNLKICIATVPWAVAGATVGTYEVVNRTVLDIRGLTPALAQQFQTLVGDTIISGNLGNLRDATLASDTSGQAIPWSAAPDAVMSGSASSGESAELQAYLLLGSGN